MFNENKLFENDFIMLGLRLGNFIISTIFLLLPIVQEMLEALKALSTFFVENSLRTRRNLRGDIERRSLAINEEFVSIFKKVKEVCVFIMCSIY